MAVKINPTDTHILVYTGAPYGDGEGGRVVKSGSETACRRDLARRGECFARESMIIALDEIGLRRYTRNTCLTAREYFAHV